jgi:hypothetical protein
VSIMKTIRRMDFNYIDDEGLACGLVENAPHRLFIGDMVLAMDAEHNACLASVVAIEYNGIVHLQLDRATWQDGERIPA